MFYNRDGPSPRVAPRASARAGVRDAASPSNLPPDGDPDLLAFDPVPLRYRSDGLTPERQRAYVEALADTGVAREAAARIGISERAVARLRRRADARSFDRACEAAHIFGARRLRSIAWERAIEGTIRGRYYRGELIAEERVFDNRLLIYLLGKVEHLLQPPAGVRAVCDRWEEHMDALEAGMPPPGPNGSEEQPEFTGGELIQDEEGTWWTRFPPPAGFEGEELGEFGDNGYLRTLSPSEQAAVDADLADELEEERERQAASRDLYFGFDGDSHFTSREAGTSGTSGTSELPGADPPIEYKSLAPPPLARADGRAARARPADPGRHP